MNNDRFFSNRKGPVSTESRRKCPFPDFNGQPIHEGDTLMLCGGDTVRVEYREGQPDDVQSWWAVYEDGGEEGWLDLRLGERDQGVVIR